MAKFHASLGGKRREARCSRGRSRPRATLGAVAREPTPVPSGPRAISGRAVTSHLARVEVDGVERGSARRCLRAVGPSFAAPSRWSLPLDAVEGLGRRPPFRGSYGCGHAARLDVRRGLRRTRARAGPGSRRSREPVAAHPAPRRGETSAARRARFCCIWLPSTLFALREALVLQAAWRVWPWAA